MQIQATDGFIQSVKPLFKKRAIYRILWFICVGIFIISSQSWFFFPALILTLVVAVRLTNAEMTIAERVWQRFESRLDSAHKPPIDNLLIEPLEGVMGSIGDSRQLSVLARGKYGQYDVRLLEQTVIFQPEPKGSSYSRNYRVLELTTRQNFYHVFIDSKKNSLNLISTAMSVLSFSVKGNKRLTVEGDVNNFFNIYVPRDDKSKSLVTLTPEKLLALRDYGDRFDVEFTGNKIYLITNAKIKNLNDILIYQQSVLDLINSVGVDVTRKRKDAINTLDVITPKFLIA